jgi:hypothetical protein
MAAAQCSGWPTLYSQLLIQTPDIGLQTWVSNRLSTAE